MEAGRELPEGALIVENRERERERGGKRARERRESTRWILSSKQKKTTLSPVDAALESRFRTFLAAEDSFLTLPMKGT